MKVFFFLACVILTACAVGCGGVKAAKKKDKEEPEQLDPYRSLMSERINAVIYSGASNAKVMEQLALLGVAPGKVFDDFKEESKIDDWFGEEGEAGLKRYTSLTCGLSPVVSDESGRIMKMYRGRKLIDGEMKPEKFIGPGEE